MPNISSLIYNELYKRCDNGSVRIAALIETGANPYDNIPSISDLKPDLGNL